MSDDQNAEKAPQKSASFTDKAGKVAAIAAGAVAAAALIPQDELMKDGAPSAWEAVKGILHKGWTHANILGEKLHPIAFRWLSKLWSVIVWWALVSCALIVAGIVVKTDFASSAGHVLVAAGTVSFAGLGILLYALADGIAGILFFKIKLAGGIFAKTADIVGLDLKEPTPAELTERKAKLAKYRDKVRLVLAAATVLCFSMLFTMFFPAWSTLGWILCFWAMVGVALCAALYLDMQMGAAMKVVFFATIGLILGMFVIFVLDRLTGGALGFDGFRDWLRAINASELFVAFLVLIPAGLLLMGVFSKDKDRKSAFKESAKYVAIGCALLGAFLLYKGTISWKQLSGKEPPRAITKTAEKVEGAYMKALGDGSMTGVGAAPQGTTTYGANDMAPPARTSEPPPAPAARTPKPRAKKPPLPPLKAKTYTDAATAVDDLESLL